MESDQTVKPNVLKVLGVNTEESDTDFINENPDYQEPQDEDDGYAEVIPEFEDKAFKRTEENIYEAVVTKEGFSVGVNNEIDGVTNGKTLSPQVYSEKGSEDEIYDILKSLCSKNYQRPCDENEGTKYGVVTPFENSESKFFQTHVVLKESIEDITEEDLSKIKTLSNAHKTILFQAVNNLRFQQGNEILTTKFNGLLAGNEIKTEEDIAGFMEKIYLNWKETAAIKMQKWSRDETIGNTVNYFLDVVSSNREIDRSQKEALSAVFGIFHESISQDEVTKVDNILLNLTNNPGLEGIEMGRASKIIDGFSNKDFLQIITNNELGSKNEFIKFLKDGDDELKKAVRDIADPSHAVRTKNFDSFINNGANFKDLMKNLQMTAVAIKSSEIKDNNNYSLIVSRLKNATGKQNQGNLLEVDVDRRTGLALVFSLLNDSAPPQQSRGR